MRLSVLDQSIAVAGRPHDQSIRNTVALARHCEALGYDRFWVSEHHNHPTIVGTAPEIVIAAIAATTERIRIGSAGIMLPHYAPFKVAEVFRVLDALAPGRIDLGLGRAPGSDGRTAFALNPGGQRAARAFSRRRARPFSLGAQRAAGRPPSLRRGARLSAGPDRAGSVDPRQLRLRRPGRRPVRPALLLRLVLQRRRGRRARHRALQEELPAERAPSRAAFGALRPGVRRADDGRSAVPFHPACLVAHASRSGNPGTARIARSRRRRARVLRPGARGTVPQGLLRRHRTRGRRTHRGTAHARRRRRDGRRHLDLRRRGAAGELYPSRPRHGLCAQDRRLNAAPSSFPRRPAPRC